MSNLFLLTPSQFGRIRPYFPLAHGIGCVDDVSVVSGIIYVLKHGLPWKDAPKEYGPRRALQLLNPLKQAECLPPDLRDARE